MSAERHPISGHVKAFFAIAACAALIDIVTKYLAFSYITLHMSYDLIPGVFVFKTTLNTGIVLGLFREFPDIFLVISALAVPVITLIFLGIRNHRWMYTLPLGLILGGTFGNMYDRIFHDGVRDFIYVEAINWPIFNVADSVICVGVVILSFGLMFGKEEKGEGGDETISGSPAIATGETAATNAPLATPDSEGDGHSAV